MHVTYNGKKYCVRFGYAIQSKGKTVWGKDALRNTHNKRIETHCDISEKNNDGAYEPIATGVAIRDKKDTFLKEVGRRISMTEALHKINDRGLRRAIWVEYFRTHSDFDNVILPGIPKF